MNLFIDNKSGAPIYEQLYTQIKNQILSGELQPEEAVSYTHLTLPTKLEV